MKKLFLLFLCGGILFSCSNEEKMSQLTEGTHNATLVKDAVIEENAYQLYEDLQSSLVKTRSLNALYPESYGGSYLDKNGDFIVLVVENQKDLKSSLIIPDGAIIKYCKYSYQELLDVMDVLVNYKPEKNEKIYDNFPVAFIDEKLNRIVVQLVDYSEQAIKEFKEDVSNSEAIIFIEASTKTELPVTPFNNSNSEEIEYIPSCAIKTRAASYPYFGRGSFWKYINRL